jgi:hypothetical protein
MHSYGIYTAYVKKRSMSVFPFFFAEPFWLEKLITYSRIPAHVNIECPDDRHTKFKIYILELILDSYEYILLAKVTSHSHNKPIGCGASGAYALGPDDDEEEEFNIHGSVHRSMTQEK